MSRRDRIREKIMSRVRIDPVTGCYEWLGPTSGSEGRGKDYPRMNLDGQTVAVHKVMWTNENGFIPGKKQLDHACRNRKCVRPDVDEQGRTHLEMVTHKQNQKRRAKAQKSKEGKSGDQDHQKAKRRGARKASASRGGRAGCRGPEARATPRNAPSRADHVQLL